MKWRREMLSVGIFALGLAPAAARAQDDEIVVDEDVVRVEEPNRTTAAKSSGWKGRPRGFVFRGPGGRARRSHWPFDRTSLSRAYARAS